MLYIMMRECVSNNVNFPLHHLISSKGFHRPAAYERDWIACGSVSKRDC